ncbi:translation initiation factor IF-3 [Salipiger bermudensis]|uniref:translation initiation factor IF-3 n=1 Tax=Salipiger bermudensis TaxID=344736 RepID=UPI003F7FC52C
MKQRWRRTILRHQSIHGKRTDTIARRPHNAPPTRDTGPRVNDRIRAPEIRLIGAEGENLGVQPPRRAMELAEQAGLDLVEISPNANPPVCKIMDFGKFKYEQQKKANEARKRQKIVELKEIKMRPGIDDHDYQTKLRNATKFLGNEDKVKFTVRFRGREMEHQDLGRRVLEWVQEELGDTVKLEAQPKMEGRQMVMIVAPKPT